MLKWGYNVSFCHSKIGDNCSLGKTKDESLKINQQNYERNVSGLLFAALHLGLENRLDLFEQHGSGDVEIHSRRKQMANSEKSKVLKGISEVEMEVVCANFYFQSGML